MTTTTAAIDAATIREFLTGLYGDAAPGYLTPCWQLDGYLDCHFLPASDLGAVAGFISKWAEYSDMWIGVGTRREVLEQGRRGGKKDVLALPGVWIDVDIDGPGHKKQDSLAPDLDTALAVVHGMPVPPTLVVGTGGGVHGYWCFPILIPIDDCSVDLDALCERWVAHARAVATELGVAAAVDSVGNVDRILRVPGTLNRKVEPPRPVTLIEAHWDRRYSVATLDGLVSPTRTTERTSTETSADSPRTNDLQVGDAFDDLLDRLSGSRPLDVFDAATDIGSLIEEDGATCAYSDSDGRVHYWRPGKGNGQGISGNVLDNRLYVHSDAWEANGVLLESQRAYTPSQYLAVTRHDGDFSAAARALAEDARMSRPTGTDYDGSSTPKLLVASPANPLPNARLFVDHRYGHVERALLVHHQGMFKHWVGTHWSTVDNDRLRAELYEFFEHTVFYNADGELRPFCPSQNKVSTLVDALKASTELETEITSPAWLDADSSPLPAEELIPMRNGLLHVPSRELLAHTPQFFSTWSLPFAYEPHARNATRWVAFLEELWPGDNESQQALREIFGYLLSGETRQQKIFALIGAKRAGKGTIARVLTALIGDEHVAGPTANSLGERFGLQPLLGRPLAIISDARLESRNVTLVERLLAISGEDRINVDRKYREPQDLRLPTRFVLISNETPRFADASGALASRFIMLYLPRTFYGKEDLTLTETLLSELPAIFNWALDGIDELHKRGQFIQPAAAKEVAQEMADVSSPIGAFVRDRCFLGASHTVACHLLYEAYRTWCRDEGYEMLGTGAEFGRQLRTVVSLPPTAQQRRGGERIRTYEGIALKSIFDE